MSEQKKKVGRKPIVAPILRSKMILFPHKTDKEIANLVFNEVRPLIKGGVDGDEKKQRTNVYLCVRKVRRDSIAAGKKVEFRGREVVNCKGQKLVKTKWIRQKTKE